MLHIVATAVKHGRGGISTALVGFTESALLQQHGFRIIESHRAGGRIKAMLSSIKQIRQTVKPGDDVWLHCGPWFSMTRKFVLAMIARHYGANVYFHFHSSYMCKYLERWWSLQLVKLMVRPATGLIVLTPWWKRYLTTYLGSKTPIHIVANPLESTWAKLAQEPKLPVLKQQVTILTMTRLIEEKGVQDVIRALTLLPEHFVLKIAGDGEEMGNLQALTKELGLEERIEFLGWIYYEQKLELLRTCHIFCLPSRYDSFGMGYVEAMSAGIPVVALHREAIPDVVKHGETGILTHDAEPTSLAEAIQHCYEHRDAFGAAAKQHVLTAFDADTIVSHLVTDVLDRGAAPDNS